MNKDVDIIVTELQGTFDNKILLEVCSQLLNNISNELYEDGYVKESNKLTTCELSIKKLLESEED